MAPKHRRPNIQNQTTEMQATLDRKILVAIDFGTTFSGAAWAQSRNPRIQAPIVQWPDPTSGSRQGITSDKVPTEIQYEGNNYKWGFQIPDGEQRFQWFKLGLDTSRDLGTELQRRYPDPLAAPPGYSTTPEKLAADYLRGLRMHVESVLRTRLPQGALLSTAIEYIITVPAVWTDAAQAKTRACAEKAGMGAGSTLHMISEPEAAAIHALSVMDHLDIHIGDTFVLCDAGGGTVDLISYTVEALKPNLRITEASPGSGSLCGGSFLNRRFQKFLEDKLQNHEGWDTDVLEEPMRLFEERIKRRFTGTFGEEFIIPVAGLADNTVLGIKRGKMIVSGMEIRKIFEPVLKEVLQLVVDQIKATKQPTKAVLLVGGFGGNAYLRESMHQEVRSYNTQVVQVENGWTSVVRGALMKGLASTVSSYATVRVSGRSARKYYGLKVLKEFDPDIHDYQKRFWHHFEGRHSISTVKWIIQKGQTVAEDEPTDFRFYHVSKLSDGPFEDIEIEILVCSDPQSTGPPMYRDDAGVNVLVKLKAELSRIPSGLIKQVEGADGILYYKLDFEVRVTHFSAYTKYELFYQDVDYGSVAAEYV